MKFLWLSLKYLVYPLATWIVGWLSKNRVKRGVLGILALSCFRSWTWLCVEWDFFSWTQVTQIDWVYN